MFLVLPTRHARRHESIRHARQLPGRDASRVRVRQVRVRPRPPVWLFERVERRLRVIRARRGGRRQRRVPRVPRRQNRVCRFASPLSSRRFVFVSSFASPLSSRRFVFVSSFASPLVRPFLARRRRRPPRDAFARAASPRSIRPGARAVARLRVRGKPADDAGGRRRVRRVVASSRPPPAVSTRSDAVFVF